MTTDERAPADDRVLLLAPTPRDGQVASRLLAAAGIGCADCAGSGELAREIDAGVGAIVLTDDAASDPEFRLVRAALARQPDWSKVPVVLLSRDRELPWAVQRMIGELDNVTVIDRPSSLRTLLSSVQAALRGRRWQYQIRDQLVEQRQARDALQRADRRKDEFLATLSHELRNPLAPLRNGIALLSRLPREGERFEAIHRMMDRQMTQLLKLVDELLDVSRIVNGKVVLRREPVDLRQVVALAVEGSQVALDGSTLALSVDTGSRPVTVIGDASRLAQAVGNVLNNAAKYTPRGGHVAVSVTREGGDAVVRVADDGMGIPPEMLDGVFEMFAQVDGSLDRAQGGLGIGLSLVRSILQLHGGSASVHSDGLGRGSTFVLRLPALPDTAAEAGEPPTDAAGDRGAAGVRVLRVLVVDDNLDAADSLGLMLETMGHQVRVVYGGAQALEDAASFAPDAVFCDLGMPGMSGYELAGRLRALPETRDALLTALTGWGTEDDRRRTQAAGFDRHLTKPADIACVREVLGALGG